MGKETTYGTAVAATRILYVADPKFTRERPARVHRFATGTRDNVRDVTLGAVRADGSFGLAISADELLEVLECAFGAATVSTPSGFTNGRQHRYKPGSSPASMTIEELDGPRLWKNTGQRVSKITISGSVGETTMVTVDLVGKDKANLSALTGALTGRTPTFIEGWETRLYIDSFGGTAGTTQMSGLLISWEIVFDFAPGRKYFADNTLQLGAVTLGEFDATATLVFEASVTQAYTEFGNWEAETKRLVRLEFGQNEVIDAGTDEVQTLTPSGTISGGTWNINFRGQASASLAYNATTAAVQAALEAMGAIGPGNVTVGGSAISAGAMTLTFTGALGGLNMPQVTITNNLTGSTPVVTPSTTTPGTGSKRAVLIDLPGAWSAFDLTGEDEGTRTYELTLQTVYDTTNAFSAQIDCITSRTASFA